LAATFAAFAGRRNEVRHWWYLLPGVMLAFMLAMSCASPSTAPKAEQPKQSEVSEPIAVTDDAGRSVKLARPATKIVSLAPSNTELLYAVGVGDKVVAVDDYSDYPVEAKGKEKIGGFAKINLEKVVSLGADLVLATHIHEKTIVPELERRGIPVVVIQPAKIEGVLDSIKTVGKLTGSERAAEELAKSLRSRLDVVVDKVRTAKVRPRVYFELDPQLFTVGPGAFVDDLIVKAGGQNIAADARTQWPQLSNEALITKDPEVILLGDMGSDAGETPEKVKARPGWQVISAVKNGRIYDGNADLTNRPGPRVFEGLEMMAKVLQPELFK
jgi:iron complex transport system substrate-binding protein